MAKSFYAKQPLGYPKIADKKLKTSIRKSGEEFIIERGNVKIHANEEDIQEILRYLLLYYRDKKLKILIDESNN